MQALTILPLRPDRSALLTAGQGVTALLLLLSSNSDSQEMRFHVVHVFPALRRWLTAWRQR